MMSVLLSFDIFSKLLANWLGTSLAFPASRAPFGLLNVNLLYVFRSQSNLTSFHYMFHASCKTVATVATAKDDHLSYKAGLWFASEKLSPKPSAWPSIRRFSMSLNRFSQETQAP